MIVPTLARILVREHLHKPLQGSVLTLGRQTIAMNYPELFQLFHQEGYHPNQDLINQIDITYDKVTRVGKNTGFITDDVFFGLFGIKQLAVLDVSRYEDCHIVHDLNRPIPDELYGQFDFIIDGGTFDHLFDLRTCFENVVKMLKPNGRIFQWNAASNFTGAAYLSFGPDLFFDYYVLNQFADCKVYIAEVDDMAQGQDWDLYEFMGNDAYGHFHSDRLQMVIVLAEKNRDSTWHRFPIQSQYRNDISWEPYRSGMQRLHGSSRRSLTAPICKPIQIPGFKSTGRI